MRVCKVVGVLAALSLLAGCPDKVAAKAFNSCKWGLKAYRELDYPGALSEFDGALATKPNYTAGHIGRALVMEARQTNDDALKEMETAVQLSPKSAVVYHVRACIHERMGNESLAKADEEMRNSLAPDLKGVARCEKAILAELKFDMCQVKGK
jgi:Tfp pilus assembly protein PilF